MEEKIKSEWSRLKDFVSSLEGKEHDGQRFTWHAEDPVSPDLLCLKDVAASFHHGENEHARVYFSRRPPASRDHMWPDRSPVPRIIWLLVPSTEETGFSWQIRESCEDDTPEVNSLDPLHSRKWTSANDRFTTNILAERIKDRVIEHYREYERHKRHSRNWGI
jgi:hypothetical protein